MTDEKDKEVETLDTRDFDAEIEEIIDLIEKKNTVVCEVYSLRTMRSISRR